MRARILLLVFLILGMYSCNELNLNSTSTTTTKVDSTKIIEEPVIEAIPEPDNFLGVKLGTTLASFQENYPNAIQDSKGFYSLDLHLMGSAINFDGMKNPYEFNTTTKGGDDVEINVLFYFNKIAAIYVKYDNGLIATDKVYAALVEKYGEPSSYEVNRDYFNTKSYYWITEKNVLNMLYKSELGDLFLVFADLGTQDLISSETSKENANSIE